MNLHRPGHPLTLLPALAVVVLVLLALHLGTPAAPGVHVGPMAMSSVFNGTNGVTKMHLSQLGPRITVAEPDAAEPYGLEVNFTAIEELGQAGSVLAFGNMSAAGWTVTNQSSAGQMAVDYSAELAVVHHGGSANQTPAQSGVVVSFTNPGGPHADISAASNVTMAISVTNWPWLHPKDSLALVFPLEPSNNTTEQLAAGPTDTIDCIASDSHDMEESVTWSPQAIGTDASGDVIPVSPSTAVFGTGNNATLDVLIPGGSTGFVSIQYTLTVAVVAHPVTAAVPFLEAVGVTVGAGAVGVLAILEVRRAWSRPPDLAEGAEADR